MQSYARVARHMYEVSNDFVPFLFTASRAENPLFYGVQRVPLRQALFTSNFSKKRLKYFERRRVSFSLYV
jgi:hypothetical protein